MQSIPATTIPPWQAAARRVTAHRPAAVGLAVLAALLLAVPAAPLLGAGLEESALATGRGSLAFTLLTGLLGGVGGVLWAVLAVTAGQRLERSMMSFTRRLAPLPLPLAALAVNGLDGRGLWLLAVTVALSVLPAVALPTHAALRALLRREFLVAAQAAGLPPGAILRRHLIPNAVPPLAAAAWSALPRALTAESLGGLLGLGLPAGVPSWGGAIGVAARAGDLGALLPSALLLALTLWALGAVGDGLRAAALPAVALPESGDQP